MNTDNEIDAVMSSTVVYGTLGRILQTRCVSTLTTMCHWRLGLFVLLGLPDWEDTAVRHKRGEDGATGGHAPARRKGRANPVAAAVSHWAAAGGAADIPMSPQYLNAKPLLSGSKGRLLRGPSG